MPTTTIPPLQGCSYLCNMAVGPEFRKRGIGLAMLAAAEQLAQQLGERDIYLHIRCGPGSTRLCMLANERGHVRFSSHHQACLTFQGVFTMCTLPLPARVQDKPAAGLYERGGYIICKKDVPLVRLLGIDQRNLLVKHL